MPETFKDRGRHPARILVSRADARPAGTFLDDTDVAAVDGLGADVGLFAGSCVHVGHRLQNYAIRRTGRQQRHRQHNLHSIPVSLFSQHHVRARRAGRISL